MDISVHRVKKIELVSEYPENGNSRTIRITSSEGVMEIVAYGNTAEFAGIKKADDFRLYKKD